VPARATRGQNAPGELGVVHTREPNISTANGETVSVPAGEGAPRGCRRYGRLFLRLADGA
jgi:hypothetical protein